MRGDFSSWAMLLVLHRLRQRVRATRRTLQVRNGSVDPNQRTLPLDADIEQGAQRVKSFSQVRLTTPVGGLCRFETLLGQRHEIALDDRKGLASGFESLGRLVERILGSGTCARQRARFCGQLRLCRPHSLCMSTVEPG